MSTSSSDTGVVAGKYIVRMKTAPVDPVKATIKPKQLMYKTLRNLTEPERIGVPELNR